MSDYHTNENGASRQYGTYSLGRNEFKHAKTVLVKIGTSVTTNQKGTVAVGRLGMIVQQICHMIDQGVRVMLVSSGAVGIGRGKLQKNAFLGSSLRTMMDSARGAPSVEPTAKSCAALGQAGLMALYDMLFGLNDVSCAQVLVTEHDFTSLGARQNIRRTLMELLDSRVVPIINENDVSSQDHTAPENENRIFWDNDSLAALIAPDVQADLVVLLSDVEGLYRAMPLPGESDGPPPEVISVYTPELFRQITLGPKSKHGRGGMAAKVESAVKAAERGVPAVVVASGKRHNVLHDIVRGDDVGTLFVTDPSVESRPHGSREPHDAALHARHAARALAATPQAFRAQALHNLAARLEANADEIMYANALDVEAAHELPAAALARLRLSPEKLALLAQGIRDVAAQADPIGKALRRTQLSPTLDLVQQAAPLGVVLVIFESRPDALPQIAALAIYSGNGLLLKGGKEATHSNRVLFRLVREAIRATANQFSLSSSSSSSNNTTSTSTSSNSNSNSIDHDTNHHNNHHNTPLLSSAQLTDLENVIQLFESRESIRALLTLDKSIDLVIPRGSSRLVHDIQRNTKIPVMGHSEGVCHVYVDRDADEATALNVVLDAKTNYPSACNAMETLLIHADWLRRHPLPLLEALAAAGVTLHYSGAALKHLATSAPQLLSQEQQQQQQLQLQEEEGEKDDAHEPDFNHEYGELACTVHVVADVAEAVQHINAHGSSHTDAIVSQNSAAAKYFLQHVDSACVFHNASTRFADGYRFGLGAEVGISTSRIHARGPVGIEGLCTSKWTLVSSCPQGDSVAEYSDKKSFQFVHAKL